LLSLRLSPKEQAWLETARQEISRGVSSVRFGSLLSLASRHIQRGRLEPTPAELGRAEACLAGWNPERWQLLDGVRVALVLARSDLDRESSAEAIREAFRYADEGELCALYRSLALLPNPDRFVWQAGEGCRSNMRSVFESIACDNPYPVRFFDDDTWRQMIIKALFIGAPLWRVFGLDSRLSPELARMALDLVEERRSAGRAIQPALWLCLGEYAGERGVAALEREFECSDATGRQAAVLALARAGERQRLETLACGENDPAIARVFAQALEGRSDQTAFAPFC
jgi:hypothetical protein